MALRHKPEGKKCLKSKERKPGRKDNRRDIGNGQMEKRDLRHKKGWTERRGRIQGWSKGKK